MQFIEYTSPQGLKPNRSIAHQAAQLKPRPFKTIPQRQVFIAGAEGIRLL